MQHRRASVRGITHTECLVFCLAAAALFALLCLFSDAVLQRSRDLLDQSQLTEIHGAMVGFARSGDGRLPTPGLIDRIPCCVLDMRPGYGDEDHSWNHSAGLYSAVIAQKLVHPGTLISPNEVNWRVWEKVDYDDAAYCPEDFRFWDTSFTANIASDAAGSNASYAHLVLAGERKSRHWRDLSNASMPMLGTRAPRMGALSGPDFTNSPTLRWTGSQRTWEGFVVFGDNHVERLTTFTPSTVTYDPFARGVLVPDNIHACEFRDGPWGDPAHSAGDAWLGVTIPAHCEFRATPVWDPRD
jgi:hypothetical protein